MRLFLAPTFFRRKAVAQLPTVVNSDEKLILPFHQNTRLRISISASTAFWTESCSFASPRPPNNSTNPEIMLKYLQTEIVDQEIFSLLVKEAGNLPTASARVSERLIVIDASQGLDLSFELVEYRLNYCLTSCTDISHYSDGLVGQYWNQSLRHKEWRKYV